MRYTKPLSVVLVGFYTFDNGKQHHTQMYELVKDMEVSTPVFRRGENFYFAARFDRDFDEVTDSVGVIFTFGPEPNVLKGTKVILPLRVRDKTFPKDSTRWGLYLDRITGKDIIMRAHISSVAQVGVWSCTIQTKLNGTNVTPNEYRCKEKIYILFNPWCKDDPVYMENKEDIEEYVLNDTGKVWKGTHKNPIGAPWIYGQFDKVALPAAVLLLDKSDLPYSDRGSVILVTRALSAMVNANDDDGLIVGNWSDNYEDGTSPFAWTGSLAILDEYLRTGHPVKYGQCWVFAAATVTICRALGIPCRCVSNFISGHDSNSSLTIDRYFDTDGNIIKESPEGLSSEMCWNFHVWNDVWMTRPDLPSGYGGWQIIDATPQELSGGTYRCGPASVVAVKRGEVGFSYDTPFVFAEVNADIYHFKEDHESDWGFIKILTDKYFVGKKIVTKRPGVDDREGESDMWDMTTFYKNPEGSEEERLAVYNAIKGVPFVDRKFYDAPTETKNDVTFNLVDIETVPLGQGFDVVVNMHNRSNEERNISGMISATSVFYTGSPAHVIKRNHGVTTIGPREKKFMKMYVSPKEYANKLVDHYIMKVFALVTVQETKQTWSAEDDFTVLKPSLSIVVRDPYPRVGAKCHISLSFRNPLGVPLSNSVLILEGPTLQRAKRTSLGEVKPGELIVIDQEFVPRAAGKKLIVANFISSELQGVQGSANLFVE